MLTLIQKQLRNGSFSYDGSGYGSGARYGFVLEGQVHVTLDALDRIRLFALLAAARGETASSADGTDKHVWDNGGAGDLVALARAGVALAEPFRLKFIVLAETETTRVAALVWHWTGRTKQFECLVWSETAGDDGRKLESWPSAGWTISLQEIGTDEPGGAIAIWKSRDFEMTCSQDAADQVLQIPREKIPASDMQIVAAICRTLLSAGQLTLAQPDVWQKHLDRAERVKPGDGDQVVGQARGPIAAEKVVSEHWVNGAPKTGEACEPECVFVDIDLRHKRCAGCGRLRWMRDGSIHKPGGRKKLAID